MNIWVYVGLSFVLLIFFLLFIFVTIGVFISVDNYFKDKDKENNYDGKGL